MGRVFLVSGEDSQRGVFVGSGKTKKSVLLGKMTAKINQLTRAVLKEHYSVIYEEKNLNFTRERRGC